MHPPHPQPHYPNFPQQQRRRSRAPLYVVLAVVVLLVTAGVIVFAVGSSSSPEVGDCLVATGEHAKTGDFEKVDCTAPDAAYRVVTAKVPSCGTTVYGYWLPRSSKGTNGVYCLTLNADEGDCFHQEVMFPTGKATKVDCDSAATYEVVTVVEGTAAAEECGTEVAEPHLNEDLTEPMALVYPDPPLTICTEPA